MYWSLFTPIIERQPRRVFLNSGLQSSHPENVVGSSCRLGQTGVVGKECCCCLARKYDCNEHSEELRCCVLVIADQTTTLLEPEGHSQDRFDCEREYQNIVNRRAIDRAQGNIAQSPLVLIENVLLRCRTGYYTNGGYCLSS